MYAVSAAFRNALDNDNEQRCLLQFADRAFTNEDISVNTGLNLIEPFNPATDLTIGLCPSAEIRFDLLNTEYQLEDFTFGEFTAYLGVEITSGTPTEMTRTFQENGQTKTYAFVPLGVFIAPRPDVVRKKIITVTANDRMTLFDVDMPDAETLNVTYPLSAGNLLRAMCTYVGVSCSSYSFINSEATLENEPDAFATATMREVLGWIAELACSNARFNRNGVLELAWWQSAALTLTERDYVEFSPCWYQAPAVSGLHVRNADSTEEVVLGSSGDNSYMIQNNPFLRQDDISDEEDEPEEGEDE